MKANELRIGNYVQGVRIGKVKCIFSTHFQVEDFRCIVLGNSIQEKFKPIPLTEEWLLKFGFVKKIDIYEIENFRYTIQQVDNCDLWFFCDGESVLTSLQHVHQFQNLYFALTNNELTIK